MVFVRLRVPRTIESGFYHSLQLSQIFVPCALCFASIAGVCVQLRIDTLLRDIKGLSGELSQETYLASWMGHFRTETIHSLFERFSLSNSGSTLNLTNTLVLVFLSGSSLSVLNNFDAWLDNRPSQTSLPFCLSCPLG